MTGVVLGCSHTAAVGIDPESGYAACLSRAFDCDVQNLGRSGAGAQWVVTAWRDCLRQGTRPQWAVAQWPSWCRLQVYNRGRWRWENAHHHSAAFAGLLAAGVENFEQAWLDAVITADTLAALAAVPLIHIVLEDMPEHMIRVLQQQGINIHWDQKQPGKTWLFDSAAQDGVHHSAQCHQQWAHRIQELIQNELTQ